MSPAALGLWLAVVLAPVAARAEEAAGETATIDEAAGETAGETATIDEAAADPDRPWAAGVSASARAAAMDAFARANDLYARKRYPEAAKGYRAALPFWDHPSIHGNLAVTLIHLDELEAAYAHLEAALRYGARPFRDAVYRKLQEHHTLLARQLAAITVRCETPEATVTLDGGELLRGRGDRRRRVLSGRHQIVAEAPGFLTFTQSVAALPESSTDVAIRLVPLDEAGGYEQRWAAWKPWAVVGAGAGVLAIGAGFALASSSNESKYEREISKLCPDGCATSSLPESVRDLADRGRLQGRLGVVGLILGGVTVVTGGALVFVNRRQRVRVDEHGHRLAATLTAAPGHVGLVISGDL